MTMTEFAHVKRMIAKGDIARATQLLNEILESEATDVRAKKLCGVLFMKMENMDRFDEIRHDVGNRNINQGESDSDPWLDVLWEHYDMLFGVENPKTGGHDEIVFVIVFALAASFAYADIPPIYSPALHRIGYAVFVYVAGAVMGSALVRYLAKKEIQLMMPVSHGKSHAKTHGQRNKKVLRNLWYQLCDDGGFVIFNASAMMEYVVVALIILLACVWGWEAWGWNGLSFVLFGVMFLGALVYVVGSVSAYFSRRHETINGYKWTYAIFDGRVKVAAFSPHSGAISIPATLGHCPVTSIEQGVFSGCRDLTGVAIPSSVTSIGDSAFRGCSGLMSVTIPNSVTSIGDFAFNGCSSLTSVTIPDSVTRIGDLSFANCANLTSVIFNGDAPVFGFIPSFDEDCILYVHRGTTGWKRESNPYDLNVQYITPDEVKSMKSNG